MAYTMKLPKPSTSKQISFIQWKIRMGMPELEGLKGFQFLNRMDVFEASDLIENINDNLWDQVEFIVKALKYKEAK